MAVSILSDPYTILERHRGEYAEKFLEPIFRRDVALVIAAYVADGKLMDRVGWQEYFGVDIGPEPESITRELNFDPFYRLYHGPSPIEVTQQVCQRCLVPVIVPESITREDGRTVPYTLLQLKKLVEHPKKGYAAQLDMANAIDWKYGNNREDSYLGIQFKGVFARNLDWKRQVRYLKELKNCSGYPCEIEPDLRLQITALIVEHVVTGNRFCGNENGRELRVTFGRTKERIEFRPRTVSRIIVGNFQSGSYDWRGVTLSQLEIGYATNEHSEEIGVSVQHKLGTSRRKRPRPDED